MRTHRFRFPGHPARLNELLGCHWAKAAKRKRLDRKTIGLAAKIARIPRANGKRRVSLELVMAPRQRTPDPDAFFKSVLDSCVHAGLLINDNKEHCELGSVQFRRGTHAETWIELQDLEAA